MKHGHALLGATHLGCIENEAILNTLILLEVCETLLLNTCHIEDIDIADNRLDVGRLTILHTVAVQYLALDIVWQSQLWRRDKHKLGVLVACHSLDKRVYRTTILKVAHKTDSEVVESAELTMDSKQVGHGLRRVAV